LNVQVVKDLVNARRFRAAYQANVEVTNLEERRSLDERATDYVFGEIKRTAKKQGIALLLVMDGYRDAIYEGRTSADLYADSVLALNTMAARVAARHQIPFIDLHPIFEEDYRLHARRFNPPEDGHWGVYGHAVVAEVLYRYIGEHPKIFEAD
jgi:lysophospholipase L1-like esterase